MTSFSPILKTRLIKCGIVVVDPTTLAVQKIIELPYNPEKLSRSHQVRGVGEGGDRSEVLRLLGAATETFKLEVEIDATDALETPDQNQAAVEAGIFPQLAALEALINPTTEQLQTNHELAQLGTLELIPIESPLTLLVWSKYRIVPVRILSLNVEEMFFDPFLNPLRATVSVEMLALSIDDLGSDHPASSLFMNHRRRQERLAAMTPNSTLSVLGIEGIR